jgi:hypothetical protein
MVFGAAARAGGGRRLRPDECGRGEQHAEREAGGGAGQQRHQSISVMTG